MSYTVEDLKSRFIVNEDENSDFLVYHIAREWWSRLYEYIWCAKFAYTDDVCLDAACGTGHHFKYYLAENCREIYACDLDSTILNRDAMINGIGAGFGVEAQARVEKVYDKINFSVCDVGNLPYEDKKFDKIYCISVLEHLGYEVIQKSLSEFKRTLKDNGLIILTFDYPSINLDALQGIIKDVGLTFVSEVDFNKSINALESYIYPGLFCFRAVLRKA